MTVGVAFEQGVGMLTHAEDVGRRWCSSWVFCLAVTRVTRATSRSSLTRPSLTPYTSAFQKP